MPPRRVHSGVLLIRVWTDTDCEDEPLKARVIGHVGHDSEGQPDYAIGTEAILQKAKEWLLHFQKGGGR